MDEENSRFRGFPISINAVVKRINRCLSGDDLSLRRSRSQFLSGSWNIAPGEFYVINTSINGIADYVPDIEEYARELGVLKPFETVRSE